MKKYFQRIFYSLREFKQGATVLLLMTIISDIIFVRFISDIVTFTVLIFVMILFKFYNFSSKGLFILCIMPLVVIFLGFPVDPRSVEIEKASIWLFLLLGAGIVRELYSGIRHETT